MSDRATVLLEVFINPFLTIVPMKGRFESIQSKMNVDEKLISSQQLSPVKFTFCKRPFIGTMVRNGLINHSLRYKEAILIKKFAPAMNNRQDSEEVLSFIFE